jgi:alpha-galactosidase
MFFRPATSSLRFRALPFLFSIALAYPLQSIGQLASSDATLKASIEPTHGAWSLSYPGASLKAAGIAAEVDHRWIHASDYSKHSLTMRAETGELGAADLSTVTYEGDSDKPSLTYRLRTYRSEPFADLQVTLRNTTSHSITVQDIRPIDITAPDGIDLGAPDENDRVLSDSLSEDRPTMSIRDLADTHNGVHRGVGSQLFFNRKTGKSLFLGVLTSDKFLTVFRAYVASSQNSPVIASFQVDDTGTTEFTRVWSLEHAPLQDQVELSVTLEPNQEIKSERLLISLGDDYHRQLETYAHIIRDLHRARISAPTPMGWWSWTAYYAKLDESTALANAKWISQNLKALGYNFFHIDEGYAIGRGDYLTADAKLFPNGMEPLEKKIAAMGLTPAIWTAPFEVSENSWVYKNHPEWLVKNRDGKPICLTGADPPNHDRIYALDPTHPGAQQYLTPTYSTMATQWGIRYIKLDFMEDAAIEGEHYRPNTSAIEAQRKGLEIIRAAVGDKVWLDKDGSEMLNPVGLVDMGRISQDTGHNFKALKDTATGIAARYYMNRNYFIADPDAFMVTAGKGENTLSLDEAKVSIALAAVSGGMFEIGDKLPGFDSQPERLALLKNPTLLEMAKRGEASVPVDLMTYLPEDGQPSIFFLKSKDKENEGILTVFNWTDHERTHLVNTRDLGMPAEGMLYTFNDVLTEERGNCNACVESVHLMPHSVSMRRITWTRLSPAQ